MIAVGCRSRRTVKVSVDPSPWSPSSSTEHTRVDSGYGVCRQEQSQAGSEPTASAVRHTRSRAPGGFFVVELRRRYGVVTHQGGPSEPAGRPHDDTEMAEDGRVLATVRTLSSWWSWRRHAWPPHHSGLPDPATMTVTTQRNHDVPSGTAGRITHCRPAR